MTTDTTPADYVEPVTGGWIRASRKALGLSTEQLGRVLGVRPDTIRQRWEFGNAPIPPGIRGQVEELAVFTDQCVKMLQEKAATIEEPAIVVYARQEDLPGDHIAWPYGLDWWARVAWHAQRDMPDILIGLPTEIAMAYDYGPGEDMYSDPSIITLYADPIAPMRRIWIA